MPTNKKQPAHGAKTTPAPSPMSGKNSPTSDATAETPTPNTAETTTAKPVANTTPPRAESDSETSTVRTTQRITALEIENFKGIGRPVRLDLRPITLLFGRNSAGKSTILHAFCYANEILNHKNLDADTTSAGGDNVRLGGFANLIHQHDATQDVRLRFDLDLENWHVPSPLSNRVAEEFDPDNFYSFMDIDWFQEPVASAWVEIVVSASQGKPAVTSYEVGVNDLYLGRLYLRDSRTVALEANSAHPLLFRPPLLALEDLDPTIRATLEKFTSEIKSLTTAGVRPQTGGTIPFIYPDSSVREDRSQTKLSSRLAELLAQRLRFQREAYGQHVRAFAQTAGLVGRRSTISTSVDTPAWTCTDIRTYKTGSAIPSWDEVLLFASDDLDDYKYLPIGAEWADIDHIDNFRTLMSYLLVGVGATLADELSHFRYIGPVRDLHPDTGVGSRTRRTRLWADGSAAWDLLCDRTAPGNSSFLDEINAWLTPEDRLDTGYRLEDHSYVELSANAPLVQAGRLLKGLGVSFSDRLSMDLLDHWIREQFSLFADHIHEPELLAAVIDDIKADEPIDPATSRHKDRIHASVLRHATSSHPDSHDHARQLAPLVTAGILHTAARVQRQYRGFLAVGDILAGRTRPEIQQLLSNAATAPLHTRLRLVTTSTDLRLSTSDIGVGISQILPVVVAALDPNRPALTAIEQPELHVHPRLQVELGEIFVPRPDRGGIFLLETHSEHLMLRLLRRIQETTEGTLPTEAQPLKTNDLSVVFIEQHDGETRLTSLPIDDTGEFTRHWPQGFFEERVHELF